MARLKSRITHNVGGTKIRILAYMVRTGIFPFEMYRCRSRGSGKFSPERSSSERRSALASTEGRGSPHIPANGRPHKEPSYAATECGQLSVAAAGQSQTAAGRNRPLKMLAAPPRWPATFGPNWPSPVTRPLNAVGHLQWPLPAGTGSPPQVAPVVGAKLPPSRCARNGAIDRMARRRDTLGICSPISGP
jgi:hypothetical protein